MTLKSEYVHIFYIYHEIRQKGGAWRHKTTQETYFLRKKHHSLNAKVPTSLNLEIYHCNLPLVRWLENFKYRYNTLQVLYINYKKVTRSNLKLLDKVLNFYVVLSTIS